MRNILIIAFAALVLFFFLHLRSPLREGFSTLPRVRQGNYVLDLLGHLKRTSTKLANPGLWKERMAMIGKSPVELAREYMKANKIADQTRNARA